MEEVEQTSMQIDHSLQVVKRTKYETTVDLHKQTNSVLDFFARYTQTLRSHKVLASTS
jgi:hypothetical protein